MIVKNPVVIIMLQTAPYSSFSVVRPIFVVSKNPEPKRRSITLDPALMTGTPSSVSGSLSACSTRNPAILNSNFSSSRFTMSCDSYLCGERKSQIMNSNNKQIIAYKLYNIEQTMAINLSSDSIKLQ